MGNTIIEVELFKDGLPIEDGDFNQYTPRNFKGAVYSVEAAFEDDAADEATFYVDDGNDNPQLVGVTKQNFDALEVSEKLESVISHIGD